MANVFTPYSTVSSLFGAKPSWIPDELDQQRIMAYQTYEELYWNVPNSLKLVPRGSNDQPVYIPSAMTIVDTTNRYTAPDFDVAVTVRGGGTDTEDAIAARMAIQDLMARERFRAKFYGAKRYGIMRGDWIWHITANPAKAQGSRISIVALDPGMYFPITDDNNVDRVIGCHLVEQIATPDGPRIHRLTYRKTDQGTVTVEDGVFKVDAWGGPNDKPTVVLKPLTVLPGITSLPVYHIRNGEEPGNPFGSSEVRGLERLILALNQAISDEDLTLAMEGLGMYATDAPHPTNRQGVSVPWRLGPGKVLEIPEGTKFERVDGVSDIKAYADHIDRLTQALREGSATPDIAVGSVDVQVANSGIALALQLGPILAKGAEKTEIILDVHNQMFFDLVNQWMPTYEATRFDGINVSCVVGDAVPLDRAARLDELNQMLDRKVIDTEYYRQEARKLGYEFPADMGARVLKESAALTSTTDPFADRSNTELAGGTDVQVTGDAGSGNATA